jgi:hypothetical protein
MAREMRHKRSLERTLRSSLMCRSTRRHTPEGHNLHCQRYLYTYRVRLRHLYLMHVAHARGHDLASRADVQGRKLCERSQDSSVTVRDWTADESVFDSW